MKTYLLIFILTVNALAFILYGTDKLLAKAKKHRIRESSLLMFSVIGGAFGAILGMKIFHHKTLHPKFKIVNAVFLLVYIILIAFILKHL